MNSLEKCTADILIYEDLYKRLEEVHYTALEKGTESDYVIKRIKECNEILNRLYVKKDILAELEWHGDKLLHYKEVIENGLLLECVKEKMKEHGY